MTNPKLPMLNCSMEKDISPEEVFLSLEEKGAEAIEPICIEGLKNVASVPLPASSKDPTVLELSPADWPDLVRKTLDNTPPMTQGAPVHEESASEGCWGPHKQATEVEDCLAEEESDSLLLLDDSTIQQDEWELLSAAGSVWTLESSATKASTGKSFRDAVLLVEESSSATNVVQRTKLTTPGRITDKPKTKTVPPAPVKDSEDEGGDFLADLRDEYKNGRGGKSHKMYHREQKGRYGYSRGSCRSRGWDVNGLHERRAASRTTNLPSRHASVECQTN